CRRDADRVGPDARGRTRAPARRSGPTRSASRLHRLTAFPPRFGFFTAARHRKTRTVDARRNSRLADRESQSPGRNDVRPVQQTTAVADASPESPWPLLPPRTL